MLYCLKARPLAPTVDIPTAIYNILATQTIDRRRDEYVRSLVLA